MKYPVKVVRGRGEGKRIGFPTLNFGIPADFNMEPGIYAGFVDLEDARHPAVFHFGPIPTFDIQEPALEAHLLLGLDTIPENAGVELTQFIRKIEQFPDMNALKAAIARDVIEAKKILGIL